MSVTPAPTSRLTADATRELNWEITARWAIPAILRSSASHEIDAKVAAADAYCVEHGYHAIAEINEEEEIC